MNVMRRIAGLLCALLLLPGLSSCAMTKPLEKSSPLAQQKPQPSNDAVSLLHYSAFARKLGPKQLAEETERVRLAYTAEKTDFRLLQYAMALSVPGTTAADHRRALQLLEPLTKPGKSRDGELRALASLLHANLTEQRRQEDGSASQAQKAREEQLRADDLEKKLEALKDIEKSLLRPDKGDGGQK